MSFFKIFSLLLITSLLVFNINHKTLAQTADSLIADELTADEITAEDLGVATNKIKTPGSFGHWWSDFKFGTQDLLTFDKEKKAELKLKQANLELLAAKKLSATDNGPKAKEKLQQALANYQKHIDNAESRLKNVPLDKKEAILEKFDTQQLKHQELFRYLIDKAPGDMKDKITDLKKARIQDWYQNNKEDISTRLEKALENNEAGSKFKHLQNLTTLEEISDQLPATAQNKIQAIKETTENKLRERLQNLNSVEQEKFEKYFQLIPIDAVKKTQLIDNLQTESGAVPIKQRLDKMKNAQLEKVKNQFNNLDSNGKEKFLQEHFEDNANVSKLEILEKLEANAGTADQTKIQDLNNKQQQLLKTKIQKTDDPVEVKKLEQQIHNINNPVLQKEIQDRKNKIDSGANPAIKTKVNDNNTPVAPDTAPATDQSRTIHTSLTPQQ